MEDQTNIIWDATSSTKLTSVNVNAKLWRSAKECGIGLKDALEFGILFKLADADGFGDYPDSNLLKKFYEKVKILQAKFQECEALRSQLGDDYEEDPQDPKETNKEADDILKNFVDGKDGS